MADITSIDTNRDAELLGMWLVWYTQGVNIGAEKTDLLLKYGYISRENYRTPEQAEAARWFPHYKMRDFSKKTETEVLTDAMTDVVRLSKDELVTVDEIYEHEEYVNKVQGGSYEYFGKKGIQKKDWDFQDGEMYNYGDDFYEWILSICKGWQYRREYHRFNLYKQQAFDWMSESIRFNPLDNEQAQVSYLILERQRCLTNSLYGLNKFLWLKEGEIIKEGSRKFEAWESQALILYLTDLLLSLIIAKLRQIGLTSSLCGGSILRTALRKNYFTKFVTEKGEKGYEIYDDKVKFAVDTFPDYLIPSVLHDRESGFIRFGVKLGKGKRGGANSRFKVEPPYATVINGGSPDEVNLDELGNVMLCNDIVDNGRPAMFWINPETGKMELKRVFRGWGTGGNMNGSGGKFEALYMQCKRAFIEKNYGFGIIPVFLNAFAKPGITAEWLEQERKIAYSKTGLEGEKTRAKFHQSYPETEEDVFIISTKTLIPVNEINTQLKRVNSLKPPPKKGYFEPVFDLSHPYKEEDSDIPYKPIGAKFVPLSDNQIISNPEKVVVTIWEEPEHNWNDRYYQGTDPIFTTSGHSKMSSVIWDNLDISKRKVKAAVNYRDRDYRYVFLQCLLLGLYYSNKNGRGVPELVESNVGQSYIEYKGAKGQRGSLVTNAMLPEVLQTSSVDVGIRKGTNSHIIINRLEELLHLYSDRLDSEDFWLQCKTFVKVVTTAGNEKWQPQNKHEHYDDELDATNYGRICGECYSHKKPTNNNDKETREKKKKKLRFGYDKNWNVVRVPV